MYYIYVAWWQLGSPDKMSELSEFNSESFSYLELFHEKGCGPQLVGECTKLAGVKSKGYKSSDLLD